jgi:hypothetical protein
MSEGFFDRNLRRLLGRVRPPEASPQFRERLRGKLLAEAERLRGPAPAASPPPAAGRGIAWRAREWGVMAAAALLVVAAGLSIDAVLADRAPGRGTGPVLGEAPRGEPLRVAAERPIVVAIPRGAAGSAQLVHGDLVIAVLGLKDGAEVEFTPGGSPLLSLRQGLVRVAASRFLRVTAGPVEVAIAPATDVEIEYVGGDRTMMTKSWLVPGGIGAGVGAAVVAVLLHSGNVEVTAPESRPVKPVTEETLRVEVPATRPAVPDDREARLAQADRKISELEKKLAASKKEAEKLAAELVHKKGVTLDDIANRLAELRKGGGMNVFLPGKTADLIADLKGLGPAGTHALLDLLKSQDPKDRFIAAKLLEDLKDPAAIPALRDVALNDADLDAANMAGHALALMEDPATIDTLRDMVDQKRSWQSEVNALWGLVNLGDRRGLEQAIAYMEGAASSQARAALGANVGVFMHTPDVMPIVDRTVQDFYKSAQVMEIAIEYYKAVGTPTAIQRLQAIANDQRLPQSVRDQATQALQN